MKKLITLIFIFVLIAACSSDDNANGGGNNGGGVSFDRSALLSNVADNIIVPSFQDLKAKLVNLEAARQVFDQNKTQENR